MKKNRNWVKKALTSKKIFSKFIYSVFRKCILMNKESFESLFNSYTWKRRKHLVKMFIYVTKDYIFAKIDFFFWKFSFCFVKFQLTCTYSFKLKKISDIFLTCIWHLWGSFLIYLMIRLNPPVSLISLNVKLESIQCSLQNWRLWNDSYFFAKFVLLF